MFLRLFLAPNPFRGGRKGFDHFEKCLEVQRIKLLDSDQSRVLHLIGFEISQQVIVDLSSTENQALDFDFFTQQTLAEESVGSWSR